MIVLLGAAGFVLGSFLPYYERPTTFPRPDPTLYQQMVESIVGPGRVPEHVGALLSLFGGVALVTVISMLGLRDAPPGWVPTTLATAVLVWSLPWIGWLLSLRALGSIADVGYWCVLAGIVVMALGTVIVVMQRSHRRASQTSTAAG